MRKAAILLIALSAGGCATITEGTTQQILVKTTPSGADCVLVREDVTLGHINPTPGVVVVTKTKHDITVTCVKEGYAEASYLNDSGLSVATAGNASSFLFVSMIGGGIGAIVDSASGADNKYDSPVNITLKPVGGVAAAGAVDPADPARTPAAAAAAAAPTATASAVATAPPGKDAFDAWYGASRGELSEKFEHYLRYSDPEGGLPASLQLREISDVHYIERRPEGYVVTISYEVTTLGTSLENQKTVLIKITNDRITDIVAAV